ncbi:MAG: Crp/Fnr family transcriptional regulator [Bacteroidota bacterium]|nr:Crp/Fnr family transcriptional regulator [Bacteroidota bacterium]MDX5431587.1 Crp/Fnr family transcriptional regulator [Bacteroidota bacterium]MDX5470307.1 Crp/Fnr family transcriptional regulator [Bacteroidota bacterium]
MIPEVLKNRFEPELEELLGKDSHVLDLEKGDVLLDQGAFITHIPIVIDGRLKVSQMDDEGHELFLYYIDPLESCVMTYSCCDDHDRSKIRAVAEGQSEVLMIPKESLERLMGFRSWRNFVMNAFRERFAELIDALNGIAFTQLDDRLIKYLRERAGTGKEIQTTHQEIAEDLNSSREVISRLLKQLESQGKVNLGRNRIELNFKM